jgi:hypothetical protein
MQTEELQHGRFSMLADTGLLVQELVDGKGIIKLWELGLVHQLMLNYDRL